MDTLKLNKSNFFSILLLLFSLSCVKNKNQNSQNEKICADDRNIHFYITNDSTHIFFNGQYKTKSLSDLSISQIRDGKKLKNVVYNVNTANDILIANTIQLESIDTLKINFSDGDTVILNNFKNESYYGGNKFLGCYFGSCIINGKIISAKNGINIFK